MAADDQSPDTRAPVAVSKTREKERADVEPEDDRKPSSPTSLEKPTWKYILKRAASEFSKDNVTDLAASLTYYSVLSMFPLLLALVSLLGVFGRGEETAEGINNWIQQYAPDELSQLLGETITNLTSQTGAGLALVTGLAGALWAASKYVNAFGRAMNAIYEVEEGRPFWKLKPVMLVLTVAIVVILAGIVFALLMSGGIARAFGDLIGLGEASLMAWNIAKWPVVVVLAVLVVAMLYYFTPNVEQPKFRWISLGAFVALLASAVAVALFSLYVSNFSSYNATYGIIGSVIVLLLGVWIINTMLLFGAEIDVEVERGRELQGGIEAEENLMLPPRQTDAAEKIAERHDDLVTEGRRIRTELGRDHSNPGSPDDESET